MRSETITAASLLCWGKPFESVSSTVPRQREEEEGLQRYPDCYHHICQAGGCQAQPCKRRKQQAGVWHRRGSAASL